MKTFLLIICGIYFIFIIVGTIFASHAYLYPFNEVSNNSIEGLN